MKLLEKNKSNLFYRIEKPVDVIMMYLNKKVQFQNIEINTIQIVKKPTFFNPTEGRGYINLTLLKNEDIITSINVEIIPTSITKDGLYIFVSILTLWTIAALLISISLYTFLTVLTGWIVFFVGIHLTQRLNQGKLENYVNALIMEMKLL
jgi:hypothetical protein